jgi:hypothetical protein
MTDKWGFSKIDRLQFGWTAEHDEMAERIMREFNLTLPRNRLLITQVTLMRMSFQRRAPKGQPRCPA